MSSTQKHLNLAIIGATGSVGGAALDICARFPGRFTISAIAARSNRDKLLSIASKFKVTTLCLTEPVGDFNENGYECLSGVEGLTQIAADDRIDHIVFASSGVSAIPALQSALSAGRDVSLANKESIVVAGPWVMPLLKRPDQLRPVDSEHSAIWQCMRGDPKREVKKVWLTASGGPFRDCKPQDMAKISPSDALNHPVWKMGAKVTIDSATLMNKGIECIEAMQLFNLSSDKVDALVHPKSQVHGMVLFNDGTMKMLFSQADMRLPVAAAIAWPERLPLLQNGFSCIPVENWSLEFKAIDGNLFPCFKIARDAGKSGGAFPSLLIGSDEAAVEAFLKGHIPFTAISGVVEETLSVWNGSNPRTLADALELVSDGRRIAEVICKRWRRA